MVPAYLTTWLRRLAALLALLALAVLLAFAAASPVAVGNHYHGTNG